MSNFSDMIQKDFQTSFFDGDFFCTDLIIEGKKTAVVIDEDKLVERQNGQDYSVAESKTLFYARVDELPKRRASGAMLNVNRRECTIDSWSEDMGVATIALREAISR